jgi:hypothetical protein
MNLDPVKAVVDTEDLVVEMMKWAVDVEGTVLVEVIDHRSLVIVLY